MLGVLSGKGAIYIVVQMQSIFKNGKMLWFTKRSMVLCFFLFILLNTSLIMSMTRQQLKSSGKLIKNTCMPKNGVTEDQVGAIDKGKFIEEHTVMCYIACVYNIGQAIKNNKIVHDAMIKQVDMMFPSDMKEAVKAAIENCRGVAKKYKDICEASFWTAKCMYEYDPANFVFA